MEVPVKRPHSTGYKKMKTPKELLIEAQNNQLKVVAGHRVAVLKSLDELEEFRGKDDYQICLSTIVNAYGPGGIPQTKVREVLPDPVMLAKAVKALNKVEIQVVELSSRNIVFKPVPQAPVQPPSGKVESVDTNPTGDPKREPMPPKPSEQPADPGTPVQDITGE
jgi:hypothetical protein